VRNYRPVQTTPVSAFGWTYLGGLVLTAVMGASSGVWLPFLLVVPSPVVLDLAGWFLKSRSSK
jgi:hypothetical protein